MSKALRFNDLSSWLGWLEQLHPIPMDLCLERVEKVATLLELDHFSCPVITVAGTNGKGSCVAILDAILRAQHYSVATYTSPHLFRYNERVCINGEPVSDEALCQAFGFIDEARGDVSLSYFEFGTLSALWLFKQTRLDILILEVGLGGRLDAVNVVDNDVAVVTTIDLDHCDWLGTDREAIGREKAGIFRANKPAVCGESRVPVSIVQYAEQIGAHLFVQGQAFTYENTDETWSWYSTKNRYEKLIKPSLKLQNASTALMVLEQLQQRLPVTIDAIQQGLQDVNLPGRFQIFPGDVTYIFDVAHNAQSIKMLSQRLQQLPKRGMNIAVFSMLKDKDICGSLKHLVHSIDSWYMAPLPVLRGSDIQHLIDCLLQVGIKEYETHASVKEAFMAAKAKAQAGDNIIVFGSFYTVAIAMVEFRSLNSRS